jgi:hypothetical protein
VGNESEQLRERVPTLDATDAAWPTELAARESNGLHVRLFWWRPNDRLTVTVDDVANGDSFELLVDQNEQALDVFHHPYAHAASRGIGFAAHVRTWELVADV